ncbi:MAG TPA: hypothetical protein VKE70_06400 [Candidatus Solibacter sp.]|nr:hypothetical protein [Candidatus Solibacter sp.]
MGALVSRRSAAAAWCRGINLVRFCAEFRSALAVQLREAASQRVCHARSREIVANLQSAFEQFLEFALIDVAAAQGNSVPSPRHLAIAGTTNTARRRRAKYRPLSGKIID